MRTDGEQLIDSRKDERSLVQKAVVLAEMLKRNLTDLRRTEDLSDYNEKKTRSYHYGLEGRQVEGIQETENEGADDSERRTVSETESTVKCLVCCRISTISGTELQRRQVTWAREQTGEYAGNNKKYENFRRTWRSRGTTQVNTQTLNVWSPAPL